jgi:putative ABC transport system permease protein
MSQKRAASMMRWSDTTIEATAAITQRPARTLLTALGTILGVAAFVTTTGLAATASAQVSSSFDALAATEVRVQDANPDGTNPFPDDVDQRLSDLNGVNHAGLRYPVTDDGNLNPRNTATRPIGPTTQPIPIIAATPGAIAAARPVVATGTVYNQFHQDRADRVAVLGRAAADQLGITRIDNQPAIFIGDTAYTVTGIIDDTIRTPDLLLAVIIPTTTEQHTIRSDPDNIEVIIDTQPGAAALIGRQAPLALRPQQPDRLTALVPPDPRTLRNNVESDVTSLYYALAALSLAVGTIAIANATLLNTIERRPEIGLRRALGAKRSHITRQIILEAAATGTVAGITGTALAVLGVAAYSTNRGWATTIEPTTVGAAPIIGLITGALAGAIPALRASRIQPAITLRA